MKNKIILLLIIAILVPNQSFATPLEYVGGVQNEHQYQEMVFITGKPIKFIGTYSVSEKIKDKEESITYKFTLKSEDTSLDGKLDRTITYTTNLSKHTNVNQTIGETTVTKYKEDVYKRQDRQYRPKQRFIKGC